LTESSLLKKRFQAGYEDMKEKHGLVVGELASEVDPPVCDKKKDDLQKKESDGEFEFKFSYARMTPTGGNKSTKKVLNDNLESEALQNKAGEDSFGDNWVETDVQEIEPL
jgi:hypothetical protein